MNYIVDILLPSSIAMEITEAVEMKCDNPHLSKRMSSVERRRAWRETLRSETRRILLAHYGGSALDAQAVGRLAAFTFRDRSASTLFKLKHDTGEDSGAISLLAMIPPWIHCDAADCLGEPIRTNFVRDLNVALVEQLTLRLDCAPYQAGWCSGAHRSFILANQHAPYQLDQPPLPLRREDVTGFKSIIRWCSFATSPMSKFLRLAKGIDILQSSNGAMMDHRWKVEMARSGCPVTVCLDPDELLYDVDEKQFEQSLFRAYLANRSI